MRRYITAVTACVMMACGAMPAYAASRFVPVGQARIGLILAADGMHPQPMAKLPSDSVQLVSADDENWQLTVGNCLLDFDADPANQTSQDIQYRKNFEQGFADASNPGQEELLFVAKASIAVSAIRKLGPQPEPSIACDTHHIYWISLVRVPSKPGYLAIQIMVFDGYRLQTTEERIIFFKPGTFLAGDKRTAQQIGGVAAAISGAISK